MTVNFRLRQMNHSSDQDLILVERIASGGMADLYLGIQTGLGGFEKTVAVKKIALRFSEDRGFQSELQSEAAISSKLQHRNIAQVFRCTEHDGCLALVMEMIEGKTLHDISNRVIERGGARIPVPVAVSIAAQVAHGLAYAHSLIDERTGESLEIVHRDVSPQNVMISYTGEVKLLDFGIAKAVNTLDATKTGTLKGKVRYMSPEQVEGAALDGRSDIFALGIVLQELLTLTPMFVGSSVFDIARKICHDPLPELVIPEGDLPDATAFDDLKAIVDKFLSRVPRERYQNGSEAAEALEAFLRKHFPLFVPSALVAFMQELFGEDRARERAHRREALGRSGAHPATDSGSREQVREGGTASSRARNSASGSTGGSTATAVSDDTAVKRWLTGPKKRKLIPVGAIVLLLGLALLLRPGGGIRGRGPLLGPDAILILDADELPFEVGSAVPEWRTIARGRDRENVTCRQSRSEYQPKVASNGRKLQRLINFDGINDYFDCDEATSILHRAGQLTAIAVAAPRLDKAQYLWSFYDTESKTRHDVIRGGFAPGGAIRLGEGGGEYHDVKVPELFQLAVYTLIIDSRTARMYRNNKLLSTEDLKHPFVLGGVDRLAVGMDWDGPNLASDHFGGQIGYLAFIGRAIDEKERDRIETRLMTRYQIEAEP